MPAGRRDPLKRLALGEALAAVGRNAAALHEYLWCFDRGAQVDPAFAGVRLHPLLYAIAQLAEGYPPARRALISRRDRLKRRLLRGRGRVMAAFDFCALNRYLCQEDTTVQVCRELRRGTKVRVVLVDCAARFLCGMRRYRELLEIADPDDVFAFHLASIKSASSTECQLTIESCARVYWPRDAPLS